VLPSPFNSSNLIPKPFQAEEPVFGQAMSTQANIGFLDIMKFLRLTASRVPPANERRAYQEINGDARRASGFSGGRGGVGKTVDLGVNLFT